MNPLTYWLLTSVSFNLWGPWISAQKLLAIHLMIDEMLKKQNIEQIPTYSKRHTAIFIPRWLRTLIHNCNLSFFGGWRVLRLRLLDRPSHFAVCTVCLGFRCQRSCFLTNECLYGVLLSSSGFLSLLTCTLTSNHYARSKQQLRKPAIGTWLMCIHSRCFTEVKG